MRVSGAVVACVAVIALVVPVPVAADHVPDVPALSSPPEGLRGHALWDSYYDLAPFGYEDEEYFVSGTATAPSGATAPYTTRIIVTRPTDPSAFNGVVLLDWANVSAQFENAVDTMLAREMLMRDGFAYVHVSAQAAGLCCLPGLTPQTWDPVRYAALDHPGDEYSFDIYTQVARAFRGAGHDGGLDPMGALGFGAVRNVLAAGQSQSGIRLHDYLVGWLPNHPAAVGAIDGFLVHGDVLKPKFVGTNLPVPVLHLLSDWEAVDDGVDPAALDPNVRLWEIAGSAHADLFIAYQSEFGHGPRVTAGADRVSRARFEEIIDVAGQYGEMIDALEAVCIAGGATFPMRYATSTAISELAAWVAGAAPPEHGPRYDFSGGVLATDEHGNALGGIRLPPIDVPVARYASTVCQLGGITVPFPDPQLHDLYPTHAEYYAEMAVRTDEAVSAGWLLPADAADLMRRACRAQLRWPSGQEPCAPYSPPAFRTPLPMDESGDATPPNAGDGPATHDTGSASPAGASAASSSESGLPSTGATIPAAAAVVLLAGAAASAVARRAWRR